MEYWKKQWVKIRMGKNQGSAEVMYFKKDMSINFYFHWMWYFKYRAALYQVENPKSFVEYSTGSYDYIPEKEQVAKRLKDRIISKKAKLTIVHKEWKAFKENYNSLFPLESHPKYQATIDAINKLAFELRTMEDELEEFLNK